MHQKVNNFINLDFKNVNDSGLLEMNKEKDEVNNNQNEN